MERQAFFPALAAQIDFLLNRSASTQIRVENVRKGFPDARYADRFSLLVPCCLDHVEWDIIFNCENPTHAPDIIFPKEDERFSSVLLGGDLQKNPSGAWAILKDWNAADPSKLYRLVAELRISYLQYQRQLVEEIDDPRVRFEIGTTSDMQGLEMCVVKIADKSHEVKFAIPLLQVDLSQLLGGRHQAFIHLQVVFPIRKGQLPNSVPPQVKLFAPPTLKEVFDVEDVKLPSWTDGMCLQEYLPVLREILKRQVQDAFLSMKLRKSFIESLYILFGRPLEAETIYGKRVSALVSSGIFVFLIHFVLSIQFPKQQPTLILQSCQHSDNMGKPIMRSYKDYPWSPRWDTVQMAERIYDFVVEESNSFKKYCNEIFQHHR